MNKTAEPGSINTQENAKERCCCRPKKKNRLGGLFIAKIVKKVYTELAEVY